MMIMMMTVCIELSIGAAGSEEITNHMRIWGDRSRQRWAFVSDCHPSRLKTAFTLISVCLYGVSFSTLSSKCQQRKQN